MNQILLAREHRSEHIKQLIDNYPSRSIAVLKLNVVGENKNPSYMKFICLLFNQYMYEEFAYKIEKSEKVSSVDGDYIYYIIHEKGNIVKERTMYIEDHHYLGRLIDIDVYHEKSISRADLKCEMRTCLICDNYAHICSRNKTHSSEVIQAKVRSIIKENLVPMVLNEVIAQIYYELEMHPRFGLVGKMNPGAHDDMDFELFMKSTYSIKPFLKEFVEMGLGEIDPLQLQKIGQKAEQAMYKATSGVNTQKGLIFALGIFLPAFVNSIVENQDEAYLIEKIKVIAIEIIGDYYDHLQNKEDPSHGDRIFLLHGIKGIRGEALNGFKLVFDEVENADGSIRDPYEYLLHFMSQLDDTTIIHRKGLNGLRKVQKETNLLVENGGYKQNKLYYETLSDRYKQTGISPGGSSDLLVMKLIYENLKYLLKQKD